VSQPGPAAHLGRAPPGCTPWPGGARTWLRGAPKRPPDQNFWKGPDEDLRHRVGPAPDRLAERCLAEIHQVVQRPP